MEQVTLKPKYKMDNILEWRVTGSSTTGFGQVGAVIGVATWNNKGISTEIDYEMKSGVRVSEKFILRTVSAK
jgi:hypothetical protein